MLAAMKGILRVGISETLWQCFRGVSSVCPRVNKGPARARRDDRGTAEGGSRLQAGVSPTLSWGSSIVIAQIGTR